MCRAVSCCSHLSRRDIAQIFPVISVWSSRESAGGIPWYEDDKQALIRSWVQRKYKYGVRAAYPSWQGTDLETSCRDIHHHLAIRVTGQSTQKLDIPSQLVLSTCKGTSCAKVYQVSVSYIFYCRFRIFATKKIHMNDLKWPPLRNVQAESCKKKHGACSICKQQAVEAEWLISSVQCPAICKNNYLQQK